MVWLLAACVLFLGIHLVISGTRLRDAIVSLIGEGPYTGLFALASLGAIVWMCIAYNHACAGVDDSMLFTLGAGFRNVAIPVIAIAFLLVVPGVTRGNPTSQGQSGAAITGVLRITRHPFLWGTAIWAAYHLLASGLLSAVIFFGTFVLVALIGTRAIDGKVRRKRPEEWEAVSRQTSNIPFAAIIAGRNKFVAAEYFDWRLPLAVALLCAFLLGHDFLFKVSPFPSGWLPF